MNNNEFKMSYTEAELLADRLRVGGWMYDSKGGIAYVEDVSYSFHEGVKLLWCTLANLQRGAWVLRDTAIERFMTFGTIDKNSTMSYDEKTK